ncbi:hypothetical protein QDW18_gp48 [Microbacterium phage Katzastrophic]|uniref:hypothetical protein n=1 Tax=Microbacterium phage Katzastrophic TaxID=2912654 RepID=UPI00242DA9AF|nr:hypothetical protein QDW18_gp48 [Microbacterium phage Katzastrophic]UKH48485.1 hypothetical protein SEA_KATZASTROPHIC_48 [Microbacterium phage Katzastrophic]
MIVWRLEFPDGDGAYGSRWGWPQDDKPRFLRDMYWKPEMGPDPHPAPSEDGLEGLQSSEFFGFVSPEQMLDWFFRDGEEDARRYQSRDLRVVVYQVRRRHVREGGRQCVFYRREARVVGRWDPREFLDEFQGSRGVRSELRLVQ